MACPKNSRQLPIKIELSNVQQYTRNLSTFMYDFKNTNCRINKAEYNRGCFSIMANNPISQSNQFEFNDSVLTTKAWNSSRYDGRQLSATEINKFTTAIQ